MRYYTRTLSYAEVMKCSLATNLQLLIAADKMSQSMRKALAGEAQEVPSLPQPFIFAPSAFFFMLVVTCAAEGESLAEGSRGETGEG